MQHMTPSPNTKSGASVKSRDVMLVLSKPCFPFKRAFYDSRTQTKMSTDSPP